MTALCPVPNKVNPTEMAAQRVNEANWAYAPYPEATGMFGGQRHNHEGQYHVHHGMRQTVILPENPEVDSTLVSITDESHVEATDQGRGHLHRTQLLGPVYMKTAGGGAVPRPRVVTGDLR